MNKKQTIKKTAALVLGIALAMGTTSCGFITKDNQKDLDQTVAQVNIAESFGEEDAAIVEAFKGFNFTGEVKKRELISYYVSVGYQYVNNYGYTKEDTFNMLLKALINREILGQEAAAYFMKKDSSFSVQGYEAFKTAELSAVSDQEKALLEKLSNMGETVGMDVSVYVAEGKISQACGQKRKNAIRIKEKYGMRSLRFLESDKLSGFEAEIATDI